jgi:hypothetical protein
MSITPFDRKAALTNTISSLPKQRRDMLEVLEKRYYFGPKDCNYFLSRAKIIYGENCLCEGGMTLEEVGVVMDISRERVRQTQDCAEKKLKHPKINYKFREYVKDYFVIADFDSALTSSDNTLLR